MSILVSPGGEVLRLDETLDRLKRLVADIEALKSGRLPDISGIEGSAVIHGWVLDQRPAACLRGYMEGHPTVRPGRMGITSDLWIWAPHHGFARTLSRFYRLGPQADHRGGRGQR